MRGHPAADQNADVLASTHPDPGLPVPDRRQARGRFQAVVIVHRVATVELTALSGEDAETGLSIPGQSPHPFKGRLATGQQRLKWRHGCRPEIMEGLLLCRVVAVFVPGDGFARPL